VVKQSKGFSLLEILIAMILFMIVIAAFAMAFPTGYRLNLKSYRENQAVELANAILQEIVAKPFEQKVNGQFDVATGDTIEALGGKIPGSTAWSGECPRNAGLPQCNCNNPGRWTPTALCNFYANNPSLAAEYQYSLPPGGASQPGIQVAILNWPNNANSILGSVSNNSLARITVNLQWQEVEMRQPKIITLTTFATNNRD
jgi:type II secretory pathway pseudopilin PulG